MQTRELYEVLGLQPFADGAMVDQAYWHLAKSFQTLAVTDPRARQALDELNDAYGVLGTPRLREEYDITLRSGAGTPIGRSGGRAAGSKRGKREGATAESPKRRFGFGFLFTRREPAASLSTAATVNTDADAEQAAASARTERRAVRRSTAGVQDLQASTGEMLKRWRANAGIAVESAEPPTEHAPDTTLVDIFRTEQAVEDDQDPLNAVMDVLRASKDAAAPARP